eukprot:Blabericola_migrator_1__10791@NODE_61_length_15760_cov_113_549035_g55_i0_p3_GENE_NODE_61_length_15760_cov_113_549035_g55_i0NODE_61_length_15760_cov_113_549035_g55_i0_p3_ORF_typecomplete_len493_score64_43_NODE_61_length_15760_cov_113_549035_g55_i040055483
MEEIRCWVSYGVSPPNTRLVTAAAAFESSKDFTAYTKLRTTPKNHYAGSAEGLVERLHTYCDAEKPNKFYLAYRAASSNDWALFTDGNDFIRFIEDKDAPTWEWHSFSLATQQGLLVKHLVAKGLTNYVPTEGSGQGDLHFKIRRLIQEEFDKRFASCSPESRHPPAVEVIDVGLTSPTRSTARAARKTWDLSKSVKRPRVEEPQSSGSDIEEVAAPNPVRPRVANPPPESPQFKRAPKRSAQAHPPSPPAIPIQPARIPPAVLPSVAVSRHGHYGVLHPQFVPVYHPSQAMTLYTRLLSSSVHPAHRAVEMWPPVPPSVNADGPKVLARGRRASEPFKPISTPAPEIPVLPPRLAYKAPRPSVPIRVVRTRSASASPTARTVHRASPRVGTAPPPRVDFEVVTSQPKAASESYEVSKNVDDKRKTRGTRSTTEVMVETKPIEISSSEDDAKPRTPRRYERRKRRVAQYYDPLAAVGVRTRRNIRATKTRKA